jgi:hypothetical protein
MNAATHSRVSESRGSQDGPLGENVVGRVIDRGHDPCSVCVLAEPSLRSARPLAALPRVGPEREGAPPRWQFALRSDSVIGHFLVSLAL